jgi:hypothetical protein
MKPYGMNINASFIETDNGCEIAVKLDDSEGLKLAKRVKGSDAEKCLETMYKVVAQEMIVHKLGDNKNCEDSSLGDYARQEKVTPKTTNSRINIFKDWF